MSECLSVQRLRPCNSLRGKTSCYPYRGAIRRSEREQQVRPHNRRLLAAKAVEARKGLLPVRDQEIYCCRLIASNRNRLFPGLRRCEDGAVHFALGQYVEGLLFADDSPPLMPGDNLVCAGWYVGEFEPAALVRDCKVRMSDYHHFRVHPDVASVTAEIHNSRCGHRTGCRFIGKRKRQIKAGRSVHVYGVQSRIRALHGQHLVLRNEQNVRNVTAMLLIQMSALGRQIESLAAGDIL